MMDGIGATIMGRNMFGPIPGEWEDSDWKGWWGDTPPYHCPVFVLTHYHTTRSRWRAGPPFTSSPTGSPRPTPRLRRLLVAATSRSPEEPRAPDRRSQQD